MSPRTWQVCIGDILTCARNIKSFTDGMSLYEFLDDPKTIRAVAYEFNTMGEAARAIPEEVREKYPGVPWGKMQGIRNVLVHKYFRLDEEILWNASKNDIPLLIAALEQLS